MAGARSKKRGHYLRWCTGSFLSGLGSGQAGPLVTQQTGQFHHPVSVQQPFGDQCCRIGQGGDVGAGEHPLLVAGLSDG